MHGCIAVGRMRSPNRVYRKRKVNWGGARPPSPGEMGSPMAERSGDLSWDEHRPDSVGLSESAA